MRKIVPECRGGSIKTFICGDKMSSWFGKNSGIQARTKPTPAGPIPKNNILNVWGSTTGKIFKNENQNLEFNSFLYCVQISSFSFVGMWRVCKSSKIIHPGGSGGFVLSTQGRPRPATHFHCCFLLSNHTPVFVVWLSSWSYLSSSNGRQHSQ